MSQPSILVVLGNRPQFIKHAALQRAAGAHAEQLRMVVVDTGQHYDYTLAGVFMDELAIPEPDHSLGVGSAGHAEQLARMLVPLEELVRTHRPSSVVVYGDTNSTLAGALAAAKLNVPVAHIEAGLRSFDMTMPEEVNRRLTDHISSMLFCPTDAAVVNLRAEGIDGERVHRVGDVMADVALAAAPAADERWEALHERLQLPGAGAFALLTVHRASNTEPEALRELIGCFRAAGMPIVFPMHPRTQAAVERAGLHMELADVPGMQLVPPLGYVDLAAVLRRSAVVLTDSGGLQKEAYIHGIPCVTLRDTTEWTETLETGLNVLTGRDPERVEQAVRDATSADMRTTIGNRPALYGDGDAGEQIFATLARHALASASLGL